jgi:topoisomerase-4 subunit A
VAKKEKTEYKPQDEREYLNRSEEEGLNHNVIPINGLYENWFLEYASYVILDRAVPNIYDGLKPVQRRILHSLKEMDDGRFNKAANVIGNTMKYHPHGDASIGDAMVQIGQKNLLIECQGNWGDPITGDSAAAPRYIEARLSKFALDVVFNPQTTNWQLSYDGRNKEPIILPVKFPLLLAQGADGIAVGLATKVLPHNFIELIDASVEILKGVLPNIMPDFITGGFADFTNYNEGQRGGRVRVRARIIEKDKKTLVITEVPFSTTTGGLIDSIIAANDKGKIKIKKIEDNTAKDVEVVIHLAPGISPDVTIDALYAFTDCEVSVSPNTCVIKNDKPYFMSVNDILVESTQNTKSLLKQELQIRLDELNEKWHFSSLEKIFIENKIYRDIEDSETFEHVIEMIDKGLEPHKNKLLREVTQDDIIALTEIKIKRISKFDAFKADDILRGIEKEIKEVKHNLKHINDYAISYFERLKEKYGKGRERKTEIKLFDKVQAAQVALANQKLYINRADGFVGLGLKKDEYICDCSDIDDIIVFCEDGKFKVIKVADKTFVGKDIIHAAVFKKNDDRAVYHMIYKDGSTGKSYVKRFSVGGVTRDKDYDLTQGSKGSSVLYFTANPNGESEVVTVNLKPMSKIRKLSIDIDFAELAVKGRNSMGNVVTKFPVKKVVQKSKGVSTLGGRAIWFDDIVRRLNTDGRGRYLGTFQGEDKILVIYQDGTYELTNFDLTNHFDDKYFVLEKFDAERVVNAIHLDGSNKSSFVKRFVVENTSINKKFSFVSEAPGSKCWFASTAIEPMVRVCFTKDGKTQPADLELNIAAFIEVKGMKAIGNKMSKYNVKEVVDISEKHNIDEVDEEDLEALQKAVDDIKAKKNPSAEPSKPKSNIEFTITNPDDIDMDGEGQTKLF